jgi:hypothetical protein
VAVPSEFFFRLLAFSLASSGPYFMICRALQVLIRSWVPAGHLLYVGRGVDYIEPSLRP